MKLKMMLAAAALLSGTAVMAGEPFQSTGLGFNVGYSGLNENAGIGVHARFHLVGGLRLEPTFDYYFKKNEFGYWDVMANFNYVFGVAQNKVGLYPIVGIGVGKVAVDGADADLSWNLGGGVEFPVASDFSLGVELKGQKLGDFDFKFVPTFKATYIF